MQSATATGVFSSQSFASPFSLGSVQGFSNRRFKGELDDFRVFSRALTSGEIASLASENGTPSAPDPVVNGTKFAGIPVSLGWSPAPSTSSYQVYVGSSYAATRDATPASPLYAGLTASPALSVGSLASGTYFWRVDSSDGVTTFKGPVWHFKVFNGVPGLVAAWKLNENSGSTAVDSGPAGANGSGVNMGWAAGRRANGLVLSGNTNVSCGTAASLTGTTPFSVSLWVKVPTTHNAQAVLIQQRGKGVSGGTNGFNGQYQVRINADGRPSFWVYGNSATQFEFAATTPIKDGEWHHLLVQRDGTAGRIYIDGVLNATASGTIRSLDGSIPIHIGCDGRDDNRYFSGMLDEIRIYDRALSDVEIPILINRAPSFESDPVSVQDAVAGQSYAGSVAAFVSDPDEDAGETFLFEKLGGPAWLSIAVNGSLSGTPSMDDIGPNAWTVRVTDSGGLTAEADLLLSVEWLNTVPTFSVNPIDGGNVADGMAYAGSIATAASDPDPGDSLAFSITSGPSWLVVAADGTLSGIPGSGDVGLNQWTVRATDIGALFAEATLRIEVTSLTPRWIGAGGGSWADANNWIYGNVVGGVDSFADFSNLALNSSPTVGLDGARTVGSLAFADSANAFGWTLVSGSGGPLTLGVSTGVPQWAVLNQSVVMQGGLAGIQGFVKSGDGTLQITTAGTWTGTTTVAGGTLEVLAKTGDVPYEVLQGATLRLGYTTAAGYAPTNLKVRGNGLAATSGLYFRGGASYNASGQIELLDAPTRIRHYGTGLASIGTHDVNGNGLRVTPAASGSQIDAGIQFISRGFGMAVDIASGSATAEGDLVINGPLNVGSLGFYKRGAGTVRLNAAATASNTAVRILSGNVIAGNTNVLGSNADLAISSGATLRLNGFGQSARQLGGAGRIVNGSSSSATLSLNQTADSTFSGVLGGTGGNDNAFGLVKGGSAILTLSGSSTYSGDTAVNLGTLTVNGSLASASVSVANIATIGGTGSVAGSLQLSGTIAPAGSSVGTFSAGGDVTLGENSVVAIDMSNWSGTAGSGWDRVSTNGLVVASSATSPARIVLAGSPTGFVAAPATFVVATGGVPVVGFNSANVVVDASALSGVVGDWSVEVQGGNLVVSFFPPNNAPTFAQGLIDLGATMSGSEVSASIAASASDPDSWETLVFSIVSGPAWLGIAADGSLSGTPEASHVGLNIWTVRATDPRGAFAEAELRGTVVLANQTPVFNVNPVDGGSVVAGNLFAGTLADKASDPDAGDTLSFSKVSGPIWLSVAAGGALSGTPGSGDVGLNSWTVRVTDGAGLFAEGTLSILVEMENQAPEFAAELLVLGFAKQGVAFSETLAPLASDPDEGDTLVFSKLGGPTWLSVASDGTLSGTPGISDVGTNQWSVRATDSQGANAQATLRIEVLPKLPAPWQAVNVGTVRLVGDAAHNNGAFTVSGDGVVGGSSDTEFFVYQSLSGNGRIVARVANLDSTGGNSARVGVQIRETLAANSRHATLAVTGGGGYRWMRRTVTGGNTSNTNSSSATAPNIWVRLVRSGNTITASRSANGSSWTTIGSVTFSMASNVHIGLVVGSGPTIQYNTSTFDNVTVVAP